MKGSRRINGMDEELIARIPQEIFDTFTHDQLEAIKSTFASSGWTRHPVDLRFSLPILRLRFYLVLLAGRERRSKKRLRSQKGLYPLWTFGNIVFIIGFLIILFASTFTILSVAFPSVGSIYSSSSTSFHPTAVPWIFNQSKCEETGRTWNKGECWDYEQSPMF